MSNYEKIIVGKSKQAEPFRFELAGKKFELPALTDDGVPLELLPAFLLAKQGEDPAVFAGIILRYLEEHHSGLWRHILRQDDPKAWLGIRDTDFEDEVGLVHSWFKASGIDPKASGSSI